MYFTSTVVISNALARYRRERGFSQAELAGAAGSSRQALSAVESGRAVPSTLLALRLARALGCTVEQLFWLDDETLIDVALPFDRRELGRARVGFVAGAWIAHPLEADALSAVADAEIVELDAGRGRARLFEDPRVLRERLIVAGCDPLLGLLAATAERARIGVAWIPATSARAIAAIARDEAHAAGAHLYDPESGEHNVPFARRAIEKRCLLYELARSEEGLAVAAGNPRAIRSARDLAGVRIVNRPVGAAARELLDAELALAGVAREAVRGYGTIAGGHEAVARAIASGAADAGITTRAVALAHGLAFVPLDRVRSGPARIDLIVPEELAAHPPMQRLLALIDTTAFKRSVSALGGYETAGTGRLVAKT